MLITLIDPYIITKKYNSTMSTSLPLGIAYLASSLKKAKINVQIIDCIGEGINQFEFYKNDLVKWGLNEKQIIARINKYSKIIGISINHSCQHNIVIKIIKIIKNKFSDKIIILGGVHATESYKDFLEKGADYIIMGEGERVLVNFCKQIKRGKSLSKVKGIAYKKDDKIIINPKETLIENLDLCPFPDRASFPLKNYFNSKLIHSPVNKNHTPIISSRGCPMKCSFCSVPLFLGGTYRTRSPQNIIDEINECIKEFDIKEFYFMDDNLTHNKQRIIEFCKLLISNKIKISWSCSTGVRSENFNSELLKLMKISGCNFIAFSPESGSQRLLKEVYNKPLNLNHIKNMIKESSKLNIKTCAYFVIGSEAENELDRELTKQYVIQLAKDGLDEMGIFTLMAHPNTSISKSMYNNKLNVDNWEEVFQGIVPKSHKHYYEIKKFRLNLYTQFYFFQILFHPNKILRIIKNFIIQKQETKTDRVLLLFIKTILRKMGFKVRL